MKTYITLLRGINVSGQKKIIMADLRALLETLGFEAVITYIQSGNIIFRYEEKDTHDISNIIYDCILEHYGFEVSVLTITPGSLQSIYKNNPYSERIKNGEIENKKMYFTLLSGKPDPLAAEELASISYAPEEFVIAKDVVYFFAANGYGKTKLSNNFFEKKLKCSATTRNLKTVIKLLELGG